MRTEARKMKRIKRTRQKERGCQGHTLETSAAVMRKSSLGDSFLVEYLTEGHPTMV